MFPLSWSRLNTWLRFALAAILAVLLSPVGAPGTLGLERGGQAGLDRALGGLSLESPLNRLEAARPVAARQAARGDAGDEFEPGLPAPAVRHAALAAPAEPAPFAAAAPLRAHRASSARAPPRAA